MLCCTYMVVGLPECVKETLALRRELLNIVAQPDSATTRLQLYMAVSDLRVHSCNLRFDFIAREILNGS